MTTNHPPNPDRPPGAGDTPAPAVFDRFTARLLALARQQLGAWLRARVDPEDIVQSVYKSFLFRYGAEKLAREGEELWALLARITLRKCADRARHHQAGRRAASREVAPSAEDGGPEAAGREPTPEEAAVLAEIVQGLLRGLGADERPIIELSLQGYSTQEISEQVGRAERSVRRLRERVRDQLEQARADDRP